jgi:hypothetical protein
LIQNEIYPEAPLRPGNEHRQNSSKLVKTRQKVVIDRQKIFYEQHVTKTTRTVHKMRQAHVATPASGFVPHLHDEKERFLSMYPLAGPESRKMYLCWGSP